MFPSDKTTAAVVVFTGSSAGGKNPLRDLDIDPANSSITNPFVAAPSGTAPAYNSTQYYVVPVSLGSVPSSASSGCGIQPFEEDNLLDATQRHISMDWNTSIGTTPGVNDLILAHIVDDPDHTTSPNTAGSIIVRNYLAPAETCSGALGSVACTKNNDPTLTPPYFIVRDVQSGCPYLASYVTSNLLNTASPGTCGGGRNCAAILSTWDLSNYSSAWMDKAQQSQHVWNSNITPQRCYANGSASNVVPWTRSPQYNGTPGPDDSYIGGAISTDDLSGMAGGGACGGGSGNGCVIRLRFMLPPNTPATPCMETPPGNAGCQLLGTADLRYMSITLWQQQTPPAGTAQNYYSADPDGIAPNTGNSPVSLISLADAAFTVSSGYVTLLVAAGNTLPTWLGQGSMTTAMTAGLQPVTVKPSASVTNYSGWTVNGYNVINLKQFAGVGGGPTFSASYPLLMTIRNVFPANGFNCSAFSVPFFTAEYTTGGGMMGPYVPLVDYVDPNDTAILPHGGPSSTSGLPPSTGCGQLPNKVPAGNGPLYLSGTTFDCGSGSKCTDWPNQSWPGVTGGISPDLVCSNTSPNTPQIDFVATQFPVPVDASPIVYPTSPQNCNTAYTAQSTPCSQIVFQSPQSTGVAGGTLPPPVPITLVGSGFGYLPNLPQLMTSCTGSCGSNYLEIYNDGFASGVTWDTNSGASCQVSIANWIDATISLLANLPINITNSYNSGTTLVSPLSDFTPWTLMPTPVLPTANFDCPVAAGDTLTFTVTNPQSGSSISIPWLVSASGTALH